MQEKRETRSQPILEKELLTVLTDERAWWPSSGLTCSELQARSGRSIQAIYEALRRLTDRKAVAHSLPPPRRYWLQHYFLSQCTPCNPLRMPGFDDFF